MTTTNVLQRLIRERLTEQELRWLDPPPLSQNELDQLVSSAVDLARGVDLLIEDAMGRTS